MKCGDNVNYKDCGVLENAKWNNFGCQSLNSETLDFFECSNRNDKHKILFSEPPVPKKKTYASPNYNQILDFNSTHINCVSKNFTYEEFKTIALNEGNEMCHLTNGQNVTIIKLLVDLLTDFSFKHSLKLNEL